jgi:3-hydroxyacyl-[acyl-carrier-protein] dehydratase
MTEPLLDVNQVRDILPHRYPFLLVDKVLQADAEKGVILAQKNVTVNEAFFQGHFPQAPIMPGVLILEALAQTGGILVRLQGKDHGRIALLLGVNDAKFRSPVVPGDVLLLYCEAIHITTKAGKVKAKASVGDRVAVEAEITFALVDPAQFRRG